MAVAQIAGMALVPAALVSRAGGARRSAGSRISGGRPRSQSADLVSLRAGADLSRRAAAWSGGRRLLRRALRVRLALPELDALASSVWSPAVGRRRDSGSSPSRGRFSLPGGDGRLHVTFIDVGQGDAALVRFPRGATLLVDAGGLSPRLDVRHRRPRRRAGPAGAGCPAARRPRADARRSRSHRRRRVDRPRVPAAGGLGRHSGAAVRAAYARCGRRRRRPARDGRTSDARRSDA